MFKDFIGVDFWTALFVLLNTLTLFYVASKFLFVPMKDLIDSRQREVDEMYEAADKAKADAQALEAEYKRKLSAAQVCVPMPRPSPSWPPFIIPTAI